jgi:parallel beta-helix repeat protein
MTSRKNILNAMLVVGVLLASPPVLAWDLGTASLGQSTTIALPGHYVLSADIRVTSSSPTGFTIVADGVTLDLNGHQIVGLGGKSGTGIMIQGATGVKVLNGSLANLAFGVVVDNSGNVVLRDLRIRGEGLTITSLPPETAIMIVQSKNVVVEDNAIYNTGLGVFVRGSASSGNRIANNTITANTNGAIGICYNPAPSDPEGPRGDLVYNNVITGFGTGIQATAMSVYNVFRENTIAFRTKALELLNPTNQSINNVELPLP